MLNRAGFKVILDPEIIRSEGAVSHLRRRLKIDLARGPAQWAAHARVCGNVPAIDSQSDDRNNLDTPDALFPVVAQIHELDVDPAVPTLVLIVRSHILQLDAVTIGPQSALL